MPENNDGLVANSLCLSLLTVFDDGVDRICGELEMSKMIAWAVGDVSRAAAILQGPLI